MQRIARYEITFRDIIADAPFNEADITYQDIYSFTLEDLYHAIKAIRASDPTVKDFGAYWFYPVNQLSEGFNLDRACGDTEDFDDVPEELKGYPGLKVSDSSYFSDLWRALENAWEDYENETHLSEILDFDGIIADLERYFTNRGKPIEDWNFSDEEMTEYIRLFDDDSHVKKASEKQLALARRFIDALCEKDSGLALHIKGYSCYGGNRLYPCDWKTSRDCIIRLFEKTDDPQYANTLGYIYYYGRCSGGVPEYDKAFRYFGFAAANGLYEGMYKLADMYRHGYGCAQSMRAARSLYGMVYEDSLRNFLKGKNANFADAALRMGNVYAKGIDEQPDPASAWYYYVQADYAARLRARNSDFFGNATVVINTRKALDATRAKLPENYLQEHMVYSAPFLFERLTENNNRCELSRAVDAGGHIVLTAKRIATRSVPRPDDILVTVPQLSFCARTAELSYTAGDDSQIWFRHDAAKIRFDFCEQNEVECRYEFYFNDSLVGWVKSDSFRFYGNPAAEPSGPEYRLASVRFSASGRTYDYICDDPSVQVGDTVIVEGYDGETRVEVVAVTVRRESEFGLPVERYKRILRKI